MALDAWGCPNCGGRRVPHCPTRKIGCQWLICPACSLVFAGKTRRMPVIHPDPPEDPTA